MMRFTFLLLFTFILFNWDCTKKDTVSTARARLRISLTDDPARFDKVLVDIEGIEINFTGEQTGWQRLDSVLSGPVDLLRFANGEDTTLADISIPAGRIAYIRLILGPGNAVVKDNVTMPVELQPADRAGLLLPVQQNVPPNSSYHIVLDFDAARSVRDNGAGGYRLVPVIRTIVPTVGAEVEGWVVPDSMRTHVYAIQGVDTIASTNSSATGGFRIAGVAQGTYSFLFRPADSTYHDSLVSDVQLVNQQTVVLDTVYLRR